MYITENIWLPHVYLFLLFLFIFLSIISSYVTVSPFYLKEEVSAIGRICCDSNGKLNPQSVILEGSQEMSSGQRVKLDLTELRQFALFPGQVMHCSMNFVTCNLHKVVQGLFKERNRKLTDDILTGPPKGTFIVKQNNMLMLTYCKYGPF